MAPASKKKEKDENAQRFWFPEATEGYALGDILLEDTQQNMQVKLHLTDGSTKVRGAARGLRAARTLCSAQTPSHVAHANTGCRRR